MKKQRKSFRVHAIDHLVLTVQNVRSTCDFYRRVMGMDVVHFERGRTALRFGRQKINLHKAGNEFEPKARRPTRGSADICFTTSKTVSDWERHLKRSGVQVIEGPAAQTGARGTIQSIYFRDPDGNLVEVSKYE